MAVLSAATCATIKVAMVMSSFMVLVEAAPSTQFGSAWHCANLTSTAKDVAHAFIQVMDALPAFKTAKGHTIDWMVLSRTYS